jgi:hypothetical protein
MITNEMRVAEIERLRCLDMSHVLLDAAKGPTCNDLGPDEYLLEESIRNLMIGSHAGRIGL